MVVLFSNTGCSNYKTIKEKANSARESKELIEEDKTEATKFKEKLDKGTEVLDTPKGQEDEAIFEAMRNAELGNLKIGMKADEVMKELGECQDKGEATVWEADGLEHQDWDYKDQGINLDMIRVEDSQIVSSIYVVNPYKERTDKGIGIGSTREDVLKAYEKEINSEETNDSSIVVGSIYGGLIFGIKDGVVSSVFIGAAAE